MAALKGIVLAALGLYMAYAALMIWLHPRFIYPFSQQPFAHAGYTRHDLSDGPVVYAHDAGTGAPLVVYIMGNAGSLELFVAMLDHHRAAGRSVVAMGFRGGGGLPGAPSEPVLKADALAAFDAAPGLVADPGAVIVQGYSLGTGLALHVAARRAVDGLILSAPYAKLCRLMAQASYLPACLLPGVQKWNSQEDAQNIRAPSLVLHGGADRLIPTAEGELLASFLPSQSRFVRIDGAGHTDLMRFPSYLVEIDEFAEGL
ncbi:alpha/beta hydrolase [Candidatus Rhodobacter oscarellae]|nr:alpha/beta hydrolase [Candidatus Rhodobacter lobularis]